MRQYIVTLLAVLLVACGDNPTNPPESTADQLRVINGPATCDACDDVEFTVAGPGLNKVIDASLKNHATGADIETSAEIRHFVGDSGPVLQIKLGFVGSAPTGDYDLRLHTVETGGAQASLNIPIAVKILTPPNGTDSPPPPPGPTGTVRVTATTSGPAPQVPYLVIPDPCDPIYSCPGRQLDANGSVSIQLSPGSYTLALTNVPANCTVTQKQAGVTVVVNQIVNARFAVSCTIPASGSIRITAATTGFVSASSYEAIANPCDLVHSCSGSVPVNGTGTMVQSPGSYTVNLENVPPACTVAEPRSVAVTVTRNQTVDISFSVTCPPPGTVRVTASVTGPDPDDSYDVLEGQCYDDYYYYCNTKELVAGGSVDFSLAPGDHVITLNGVAQNCVVDGSNSRTVTVVPSVQTEIHFTVSCVAIIRIHVSAPTTGPDADVGYVVAVGLCSTGPCTQLWLDANGTVDFVVTAGTYVVHLTDVASNCTVTGTNPAVVTVSGGSTTNVSFPVTCTALPAVRVTAPTAGTNRDASYIVVNESSCDYYSYYCSQQVLPAAGAVEFKLTPGSYVFRLTDIASNCTVTGPNPATVNVVLGVDTELAFPVTCQ